jgi:hypothetical protein
MRGHKGPVQAYVQQDREGSTHIYLLTYLLGRSRIQLSTCRQTTLTGGCLQFLQANSGIVEVVVALATTALS